VITTEDLQYLKRATPAQLVKLTNGVPWPLCAWIKVTLTQSKPLTPEQMGEAIGVEMRKWTTVGAPHQSDAASWIREHKHPLTPCPECGAVKYPHPEQGRRITFTRENGFGLHYLCGQCCKDFDHHYDVVKLLKTAAELAKRWQGRCLAPREVAL
jgi:hypothetical protein